MDLTEQIDKGFLQLASLSDDRINLTHGALLIAKAAYPDLDESLYLARLDRLAADVKRDLAAETVELNGRSRTARGACSCTH